MKRTALLTAILVALFAALAPAQTAEKAENKATTVLLQVKSLDLSKLHSMGKKFLITRQDERFEGKKWKWAFDKKDGDIVLLTAEYFTDDSGGTVSVIYPMDKTEICAFSAMSENGETTDVLIAKDGRSVTVAEGRIGYEPIKDDNGKLIGIRVFLASENDKEKNIEERDFMITK